MENTDLTVVLSFKTLIFYIKKEGSFSVMVKEQS